MKKPSKFELSSELYIDIKGKLREYKFQKEVIGLKEIYIDTNRDFVYLHYITK